MKTRQLSSKMFAILTILSVLFLMESPAVVHAAPVIWDISTGDLMISAGGEYTATGSTTNHTISVGTSDPVTITLANVTIDVSAVSGHSAFDSGENVTLYLQGSNTLKSGANQAGIKVTDGERLTIDNAPSSQGSLSVKGGGFGAGIGGGYMQNGGSVTIRGGVVRATGGDFAAGIGGAYTGNGGAVTITGGTVTAFGGVNAAGIGGGIGGSGGDVRITGGSIKAGGTRSNIGAGYVGAQDGTLTNGFVPIALVAFPGAVAAVNPTEVSYQIPVAGTNPDYSYVYTYEGSGHGDGDTSLYFYLPSGALPKPAAPSGLTATAVSSNQIDLTWTDSDASEQGFKIERCTGTGCSNFTQIAAVGPNVTSYSSTGLSASTSYSFRVRAYNAGGDSGYSNTASALTQAAPTLPAAPTNLAAVAITKSQINIFWTDNAGNETGFRILRCKGSTCTNFALISMVGANITSYADTGLSANTTYRYRVYAYNTSGNSGYSNIISGTTPKR
jgi:hypothetical protein